MKLQQGVSLGNQWTKKKPNQGLTSLIDSFNDKENGTSYI